MSAYLDEVFFVYEFPSLKISPAYHRHHQLSMRENKEKLKLVWKFPQINKHSKKGRKKI